MKKNKQYYEVLKQENEEIIIKVSKFIIGVRELLNKIHRKNRVRRPVRCDIALAKGNEGKHYVGRGIFDYDGALSVEGVLHQFNFIPADEPFKKQGITLYDVLAYLNVKLTTPGVSGTVRNHFLRKTVVAYAQETFSALAIVRLRNGTYSGVFCQRNQVPGSETLKLLKVERCNLDPALKKLNEMVGYTCQYKLLEGEDLTKITAYKV